VPMDIYQGSKSIVKRIVYKQLGLDDDDNPQPSKKKPQAQSQQTKDKTKETKEKNKLNETLANNLLLFLSKLNDLSNLKELYVLLKGLRKDTHHLLPNNDIRRSEIQSQVNFNTLEIE